MRISDWSSDVCSSDLASAAIRMRFVAGSACRQDSSHVDERPLCCGFPDGIQVPVLSATLPDQLDIDAGPREIRSEGFARGPELVTFRVDDQRPWHATHVMPAWERVDLVR